MPQVNLVRFHPRTREVVYYPAFQARDSGKWAYISNPQDERWGHFYLDCSHTDIRGDAWHAK